MVRRWILAVLVLLALVGTTYLLAWISILPPFWWIVVTKMWLLTAIAGEILLLVWFTWGEYL